jgi:uncharacterized membrane protein
MTSSTTIILSVPTWIGILFILVIVLQVVRIYMQIRRAYLERHRKRLEKAQAEAIVKGRMN